MDGLVWTSSSNSAIPKDPRVMPLVYFRVNTEPDKVYASYVVTLPINADLTKYVPPFLASHLGGLPLNEFSAFAMPPVPEPVSGQPELERLARLRDDDLLYGGDMFSFDLPRMMETVTEVVPGVFAALRGQVQVGRNGSVAGSLGGRSVSTPGR